MGHDADVIIVGAGLAGACAAFVLSSHHGVVVVEAEEPAAGASGAAAGLVNPFMGQRARPVWRLRKALAAVPEILARADIPELFQDTGVLRPATEPEQVEAFQEVADAYPDLATWVPAGVLASRYSNVQAEDGALFIPRGGAMDVAQMVRALLRAAENNGAVVKTNAAVLYWRETPDAAIIEIDQDKNMDEFSAEHVLLTLGQGYPTFPELRRLGLTGVKGQTVRVRRPRTVNDTLPPLSGQGYVVPDGDSLVLGSNYDNDFDTIEPDPDATESILEKTAQMVPVLESAEVVDVNAGVRVKHTESNLPLLGPLPHRDRIWTFTALGSKGLLTAPMLSLELPEYLENPGAIPDEVRPPL